MFNLLAVDFPTRALQAKTEWDEIFTISRKRKDDNWYYYIQKWLPFRSRGEGLEIRTVVVLLEHQSSIPRVWYGDSLLPVTPVLRCPTPFSDFLGHQAPVGTQTYKQKKNTHLHKVIEWNNLTEKEKYV